MLTIVLSSSKNIFQTDTNNTISDLIISSLKDKKLSTKQIIEIGFTTPILDDDDYQQKLTELKKELKDLFNNETPAFNLIAQKNADPNINSSIEILINDYPGEVHRKEFQKHSYSILEIAGEKHLFSGGLSYCYTNDMLRSAQEAYDFAEQLLDHEEMHFGHMIYLHSRIEALDQDEQHLGQQWKNPEILKQIREFYFDPTLLQNNSPLVIDQGMICGGVNLSFCASSKDGFPTAIKLSNDQNKSLREIPATKNIYFANLIDEIDTELLSDVKSQTDALVSLIEELLTNSHPEITKSSELLKVSLAQSKDFETIKSIIERRLSFSNITFLSVQMIDSKSLVDFEGYITLK